MVQPDADDVTNGLTDACRESLGVGLNSADRPRLLFHFTNAEGLLGILDERGIWASLATALDDESEIRYATELAKEHLSRTARAASADRGFREAMLSNLNGVVSSPYGTFSTDCYVTSFCPHNLSELHWSHYGCDGAGYAIGLDAGRVQAAPFDLAPILYYEDEQIGAIERLCRGALNAAGELSREQHPAIVRAIEDASAHIAATYFSFLAPRIKPPSLVAEAEWRLVSLEVFHNGQRLEGGGVELHQGSRRGNGKDVPYHVNNFAGQGLPITELLVGPTAANELRGKSLACSIRE